MVITQVACPKYVNSKLQKISSSCSPIETHDQRVNKSWNSAHRAIKEIYCFASASFGILKGSFPLRTFEIPYGPKYLGFRVRLCQSCSLLILYLLRCLTLRKCLQNVLHSGCPNPAVCNLDLQHCHPQYLILCFIVIRSLIVTWVILALYLGTQGFKQ